MQFTKHFKLKPYWEEFELPQDTETKVLEIDGIEYGFGGNSITILPEFVSKFVNEDLSEIYYRDNLALKIFYKHPVLENMEMYECFWGAEARKVIDASVIQNILSIGGFSPRVFDLVFLTFGNLNYPAQVTEFIRQKEKLRENEYTQKAEEIREFAKGHDIYEENITPFNFVGNQFVDFGEWYSNTLYKTKLQERIRTGLKFAGSDQPYQSVENLHVKGQRDNLTRYNIFKKAFKKDRKLLPEHFTAIDFGCSGGFFLRRAFDWGAKWVLGIDEKEVIDIASEVTFFLNYFNADFSTELPDKKFDLGFYLSMDRHTDFEQFVPCVKKVLYLEGHSSDPQEKYIDMLKPHFKEIEFLGTVSDYGERVLFRAVR